VVYRYAQSEGTTPASPSARSGMETQLQSDFGGSRGILDQTGPICVLTLIIYEKQGRISHCCFVGVPTSPVKCVLWGSDQSRKM